MNNFSKSLGGLVMALSLSMCGNKSPEETVKLEAKKERYSLVNDGTKYIKINYNDTVTYLYDSQGRVVEFTLDGRGSKKDGGGDGTIDIIAKMEYDKNGHKIKETDQTICYENKKANHFHTKITEYEVSVSGFISKITKSKLPIEYY